MRTEAFELRVLLRQVGELRGAHESEVRRIKDEDRPLAGLLQLGERDAAKVTFGGLVGFHGEIGHIGADGDGDGEVFHKWG